MPTTGRAIIRNDNKLGINSSGKVAIASDDEDCDCCDGGEECVMDLFIDDPLFGSHILPYSLHLPDLMSRGYILATPPTTLRDRVDYSLVGSVVASGFVTHTIREETWFCGVLKSSIDFDVVFNCDGTALSGFQRIPFWTYEHAVGSFGGAIFDFYFNDVGFLFSNYDLGTPVRIDPTTMPATAPDYKPDSVGGSGTDSLVLEFQTATAHLDGWSNWLANELWTNISIEVDYVISGIVSPYSGGVVGVYLFSRDNANPFYNGGALYSQVAGGVGPAHPGEQYTGGADVSDRSLVPLPASGQITIDITRTNKCSPTSVTITTPDLTSFTSSGTKLGGACTNWEIHALNQTKVFGGSTPPTIDFDITASIS
jgi:hypothetical protein